jgi:hypothetical protein
MDGHGQTKQFLPNIPVDPMTGTRERGVRTFRQSSGIYYVYTKSKGTALGGAKYEEW